MCLVKERNEEERNWVNFYFSQVYLDERKMRGKDIEEELFSLICLCEKMKEKKNNNTKW